MKLLVLEGLDGAGKSTQINLIKDILVKKNIKYKFIHFPRTDSPVWGELISMFLRGDLGNIDNVNPYLVALIYAGDRNDAKKLLSEWIKEGYTIILDRYVYSNIAFQCAKIADLEKKQQLKEWIKKVEFEYNSLIVPDISLFLDVPFEFTKKKLTEARTGSEREYLKGKEDIHEQNLSFQNLVRDEYLSLVKEDEKFVLINCSDDGVNMLSQEEIFNRIKLILDKYI